MGKKLTKKQEGFANDYIDTGNATEAVVKNYNVKDRNVAKSIGSENLTKPDIKQYIEQNASSAMSRIVDISISAKNEAVKLSANKDIMDRAGYKPVEKADITSNGEKIEMNPKALELAKKYEQELKKTL